MNTEAAIMLILALIGTLVMLGRIMVDVGQARQQLVTVVKENSKIIRMVAALSTRVARVEGRLGIAATEEDEREDDQ